LTVSLAAIGVLEFVTRKGVLYPLVMLDTPASATVSDSCGAVAVLAESTSPELSAAAAGDDERAVGLRGGRPVGCNW